MDTVTLIAIIVFFLAIAIEAYIVTREKIQHAVKGVDIANNLLLGGTNFFVKTIFIKGATLGFFAYFHQYALFDIGNSWWAWVLLFFLNDLLFYFFHRWSHEVRLLWASHSVHHSSELMNFSTSIRGVFILMLYRFLMWFPLAFIGFSPAQIVLMDAIAFFYQFPLHTTIWKKWGIFEYFLNTPSHHRVHHGSNPQYLDKNYGAVLIIWDKMFGTFAEEKEPVVYGLTHNIHTENPIKIAFHEWIAIFQDINHARSFSEAMGILFKHPGWKASRDASAPQPSDQEPALQPLYPSTPVNQPQPPRDHEFENNPQS